MSRGRGAAECRHGKTARGGVFFQTTSLVGGGSLSAEVAVDEERVAGSASLFSVPGGVVVPKNNDVTRRGETPLENPKFP
mmetsp:Transcript_14465/g.21322  ORF Transcript_14465/g.21322 Transcript_14465/m.21322 type:complete len:80 (-) Transcript_14465:320-559(-)